MFKKVTLTPRLVLTVYIVFNLILGVFIVGDYGISTDESPEGRRAELALSIFAGTLDFNPKDAYADLQQIQYYGTATSMLAQGARELLQPLLGVQFFYIDHYVYYLTFQIGIIAMFYLAAKFVRVWGALLAAFVFGTQPLFFGHSFMNPKDIPLLGLFLATVAAGFYMVDHLAKLKQEQRPEESAANTKRRKWLLIILLVAVVLQFLKGYLLPALTWFVNYAYDAPESNLAHRIFQFLTSTGSLEGYLILVERFVYNFYKWIVLFFFLALLFFGYQVRCYKLFAGWVNLPVLLAGAVWGFAISTRVIALAAGGIVGLYGLAKLWKKGIPYLVSYTLTAAAVSYITWPYLWLFGFKGFLDSLLKFSDFAWEGEILFEGKLILTNNLPARFLPKLMLLQFTEPLVILALAGFVLSIYLLYTKKLDWVKTGLLYAWFALPLLYTILAHTVTYNNFRQYLFITPPLFILAALVLDFAASRINRKVWLALAAVVILLPGVFSLIQLHPYQYIYYNQFTGGVAGAYHKYELDYWIISYKELAQYIQENITPGSRILVWMNEHRIRIYTGDEYILVNQPDIPEERYDQFEYAVIPSVRFYDLLYLTDQPNVYEIVRDHAVIAVIKKID